MVVACCWTQLSKAKLAFPHFDTPPRCLENFSPYTILIHHEDAVSVSLFGYLHMYYSGGVIFHVIFLSEYNLAEYSNPYPVKDCPNHIEYMLRITTCVDQHRHA
jgi:hypothetical protein